IHGAGHENGRRAGTENIPHIVALGAAAELARNGFPTAADHLRSLRDRLWNRLRDALDDRVILNGHPAERLANTLNLSFVGCVGSEFLAGVPEIAASTGSACHDGKLTISPVLAAMNVPAEIAQGAVRLSVGRFTTTEEIDRAAELLIARTRGQAKIRF